MIAARKLVALAISCLATAALAQGAGSTPSAPPEERPVHVVFFEEQPLATYRGTIPGLAATNPRSRGERRLDPDSPASRAYLRFLERRQDERLTGVRAALGRRPPVLRRYLAAGSAVALRLSPAEASAIAALPGVKRVVEDYVRPVDTDRGPWYIGAPGIWDGSDSGGTATLGEGILVGIIDTGVNMLHPSFSDTPVDGHVYSNPLGSGNYLGWCDPSHPSYQASYVCNDKLIGAWDFVDSISVDNDGPEDSDGHGSHTAGTAAGNRVDYSGDGVPDLSGVAPHANLITYDVCYVDPGTGQGLCPFSATSAAVNQAILDGVQAVNYSISGGTVPWSDIDAFFLDAVAAGMFVATSAGNAGPGAATVAHRGPWVSSVAATTHDRLQSENALVNMSGGTSPPADIDGLSRTGGFGPAPIVYAGDFSNGTVDPEQCLQPFPAGTWSGEIVVCDRGGIARVMKGQNVFLGGAGALVLANISGGNDTLSDDPHLIPGIHISTTDGNSLRTWLASGSGHTATITASTQVTDAASGDITASFSSRGPNTSFDVLKPDLATPGVDILAAVGGSFFDEAGIPPYQGLEVFFLSGTSMASPHTAGAGALLRALHPTWSPLQVKSALMTTAHTTVLKEDAITPADPFDVGAGRVDLSRAGRAGLLFDEAHVNLLAADPALGGDPSTLNIPSLMDSACPSLCSWTRTVESPLSASVTWTASSSGPSWMTIDVQPPSFVLAPGASQTLDIVVTGDALTPVGVWAFGQVTLTPDDFNVPAAHLPVAVLPTGAPALLLDATQVDDTVGNANGIAEPHEIITLAVDLRNEGTGDASMVAATLTSSTPGITIVDGSAAWPAIGPSLVEGSQSPHFQFRIDGSVPCGTLMDFDLNVSTTQGPFPLSFQHQVGLFDPVICAPVPCKVFAAAAAAPALVCAGGPSTVSGLGAYEVGEDCAGTLEYRFSDGSLVQDWSTDVDVVVSPAVSTAYNVDARDAGTLAADTVVAEVTVLPAQQPVVVQTPSLLCAEGGSVDLDAGPGFVSYLWTDELEAVVGTAQVLSLGLEACDKTYTVTAEGANGCSAFESHSLECPMCTPPEVSGAGTAVPFRMGLDALGTIEFELLPLPEVTYNLYQAATLAEVLAGDWTYKYCDLSSPSLGTWTIIAPDTVRWTPLLPGLVFEGHWVVVAEQLGYEGSFGPRLADVDGQGIQRLRRMPVQLISASST